MYTAACRHAQLLPLSPSQVNARKITSLTPMLFLPSSMKPPHRNKPFLLFLFLAIMLPLPLHAAEGNAGASAENKVTATAPTGNEQQQTKAVPPDETVDMQTLREQYRQDPTGVRARLGMCRKGQGGHGGGRHRRHRGGEQWNNQ